MENTIKTRYLVSAALLVSVATGGCALDLFRSAGGGDYAAVQRKLMSGTHVDIRFPMTGTTPLILASGEGHLAVVQKLIEHGADVNAADNTGWTALHAAAFNGNVQIVRMLLEHGAVPVPGNWYTPTPADLAVRLEHHDVAELLTSQAAIHDSPPIVADRRR